MFQAADREEYSTHITLHFTSHPLPMVIEDTDTLTTTVDALMSGMLAILQETVPLSSGDANHKKRWWTRELTGKRKELKRLQHRAARRNAPEHTKRAAALAGAAYRNAVRSQKRRHWNEFVENATGQDIWRANKYTSDPPKGSGPSRLPLLQAGPNTLAHTNSEKGETLMETFFPDPPDAALDDTIGFLNQYSPVTLRKWWPHSALTENPALQESPTSPSRRPAPSSLVPSLPYATRP